ncbi:MAG: hypothetical protein AAF449_24610 [Myxococcota bacterium]
MMKVWLGISGLAVVLLLIAGFAGCGESTNCPGIVCNSCSVFGDCNVDCSDGQIETCVGLEAFDGDNPDDQRCAFCDSN